MLRWVLCFFWFSRERSGESLSSRLDYTQIKTQVERYIHLNVIRILWTCSHCCRAVSVFLNAKIIFICTVPSFVPLDAPVLLRAMYKLNLPPAKLFCTYERRAILGCIQSQELIARVKLSATEINHISIWLKCFDIHCVFARNFIGVIFRLKLSVALYCNWEKRATKYHHISINNNPLLHSVCHSSYFFHMSCLVIVISFNRKNASWVRSPRVCMVALAIFVPTSKCSNASVK